MNRNILFIDPLKLKARQNFICSFFNRQRISVRFAGLAFMTFNATVRRQITVQSVALTAFNVMRVLA